MNFLNVGLDPSAVLQHIPDDNFLLIDDADHSIRARRFDISKHSFNPLKDMDERHAREFVSVLESAEPGGENTLTYRYSRDALLDVLLAPAKRPKKLSTLFPGVPDRKDTATYDAYLRIKDILRSPVLKRVLDTTIRFPFEGKIVARINRAELGKHDAFILVNLLIQQFPGTIVIPRFAPYARPFHADLIEQGRLVAGITSFDHVPSLKNDLMQIEHKIGRQCTPADAKILADYAGLVPDPLREDCDYNLFVRDCVTPFQRAMA